MSGSSSADGSPSPSAPAALTHAPALSVVVVTWNSARDIEAALPALLAELRDDDELIVVDNGSADGCTDRVSELAPDARLVRNAENLGFVVAVNQGAEAAVGDLLVLLNPDAQVRPGWRDGIELPWTEERRWGAWQALMTSDGGTRINSDGNVMHYTGICWAGRAGRPIAEAAAAAAEIGYASGACLAIPLALWRELGGFPERLFMYGDDADISLLVRLRGLTVGIEPAARVEHDYEFDKGPAKWRYLERSRWAFIIRCYPGALLVPLLPALLATEMAITLAALRGGWLRQKLRATGDLLGWLPGLLRERRQIQRGRRISAAAFASHLAAELDSDFLGPLATSRPVNAILKTCWRLISGLLSAGERGLR